MDLGGGWAATALKTRSVVLPEMAEMGKQRLDLLRAAMMVDLGGGWAATALKTRSVVPPEMTLGPAESCYVHASYMLIQSFDGRGQRVGRYSVQHCARLVRPHCGPQRPTAVVFEVGTA